MQSRILEVGEWPTDDDNPTFPVGSQPKTQLICPEDLMSDEVIPRHRYLFKTPADRHRHQIWSEFIAYRMSILAGVDVPRCWIAVEHARIPGVLVEFFYGFPSSPNFERFVHGAELLTRFILDKKRGRPHGIVTNVRLARRYGIQDARIVWGKIIAFDALIGNSDRHPENWGIIWWNPAGHLPTAKLAPAYDNATSLGQEWPDGEIEQNWSTERLARYVARGRHHCGWSPADDTRARHIDLCARYLGAFPEAGEAMRSVIRFSMHDVEQILEGCVQLGGVLPFTAARARFVYDQVRYRRERLMEAMGV